MRYIIILSFFLCWTAQAGIGNDKAPKGGTFYLNLGSEPPSFHPISSTTAGAMSAHSYAIETLLGRNLETYEWQPELAHKWEVKNNGKTFVFHLRKEAVFHDGKPVTAEDVKFSFDAVFDDRFNAAPKRPYLEGLRVEVKDKHTVIFHAKEKLWQNFESAALMGVVPKHIYHPKKGPKLTKTFTGSGPYQLDKYQKGKRMVLKRFDKWWGWKKPEGQGRYNANRIIFRFVKDESISLEMLKKGDLDFEGLTPESYVKKAKGAPWGKKVFKVKTKNKGPKGYGFVAWNLKNELFKDREIRVALAHLMNRELMIEKFLFGFHSPATGPWHRYSDYASKKIKPIPFSKKKALALFKKAGWKDSDKNGILDKVIQGKKREFKFTLLMPNPIYQKYFTIYKEDAKSVGVEVDLRQIEWNSFVKLLEERKFEAVVLAWGGGTVDISPKQIWHSESSRPGGSNFIHYHNPKVDQLIDESREILDKKTRIKKLKKVYEMIAYDAPYLFMFNGKNSLYGHTKRVKRPKDSFRYGVGTSYWWIDDK